MFFLQCHPFAAIALAHHQLTADSLLSAVQNVDIRLLEPDFILSFESILPDQNEVSMKPITYVFIRLTP